MLKLPPASDGARILNHDDTGGSDPFASSAPNGSAAVSAVDGAGERFKFTAANDDRTIDGLTSRIRYSRASRWPYVIALLASLIWMFLVAVGVMGGSGISLPALPNWILSQEGLLALMMGAIPCALFFVIAAVLRRLEEARVCAEALVSAMKQLTQLDDQVSGNVVSLGASIRQQASGIGDSMERAVARAVELEGYVRAEIGRLEQAYGEGERRVSRLLDQLHNERAAIGGYGDAVAQEIAKVRRSVSSHVEAETSRLLQSTEDAERRYEQIVANQAEALAAELESQSVRFRSELDNALAGAVSGAAADLKQIAHQLADQWKNEANGLLEASSKIVERLCLRLDTLSNGELEAAAREASTHIDGRLAEARRAFDDFCASLAEQTQAAQIALAQHMKDNASDVAVSARDTLSNEVARAAGDITERLGSMFEAGAAVVVERMVKTNEESNLAIKQILEFERTETASLMQEVKETFARAHQVAELAGKDNDALHPAAGAEMRALSTEIAERLKLQQGIMESWLETASADMNAAIVDRLNYIYRLLFDEQSGLDARLRAAQSANSREVAALAGDVNAALNATFTDMRVLFERMSEEISTIRLEACATQGEMRALLQTLNLHQQSDQSRRDAYRTERPAIAQADATISSAVRQLHQASALARESDVLAPPSPKRGNDATKSVTIAPVSSSAVRTEGAAVDKRSTEWLLELLARAEKA